MSNYTHYVAVGTVRKTTMTREDIIRMVREASNNDSGLYEEDNDLVMLYLDELERFAALVARAEREACAKVCEELWLWNEDDPGSSAAKAIRARANADGSEQ